MTDPLDHLPRRYFVDECGRRVLIGLSMEETFEFETLDNLTGIEGGNERAAWEEKGSPATMRERRWQELYGKHDRAWRQWMVETAADRLASLPFINQLRVT